MKARVAGSGRPQHPERRRRMRVLVAAEESAGVQALRLAARHHDVVAVLTSAGQERGSSVATVAAQLGLPRWDPALMRDPEFAARVATDAVDVLLNVHSLHIAAAEVLAAPRIGAFNLHPGPLPRYAGLNSPSWAIYEGQRRHAVTLHWMAAEVDAGEIAYEAWFDIAPHDTGLRVAASCVREGIPLIGRLLDDAAQGETSIPRRRQGSGERHWYGREAPYGGRLPWVLPARRIVDLVRAADYSPFPSPWGHPVSTLGATEIEVVRAVETGEATADPPGTIGPARPEGVPVAAADEWVLVQRLRRGGGVEPAAPALVGGRFLAEPENGIAGVYGSG